MFPQNDSTCPSLNGWACLTVWVIYTSRTFLSHDDVIKWKHFPRYWPLVRGIHRSPVNSPHKGQWRGALMFSLICVWIHGWLNNRQAGDLRRYPAHYDVTLMVLEILALRFEIWFMLRRQSNFKPIWKFCHSISRIQDFVRSNTVFVAQCIKSIIQCKVDILIQGLLWRRT